MYSLAQAAKRLGLQATGMELSLEELKAAKKPLIAHVKKGHFVVVVSFYGGKLMLIDPAAGVKSVTIEEFSSGFKGYVLLFGPKK